MAQAWTDTEQKVLKRDPLHDVKEEIQHHSPRLRHVDLPEGDTPGDNDTRMDDIVKAHVPEAFVDELKKDHSMTEPATDFEETEAEYMEDDPLHDVKNELEHHSPHLRHVDSPYSPGHHPPASPGGTGGDVVKSEVPPVFEDELKNDHDIVKGHHEESSVTAKEGVDAPSGENQTALRDSAFVRGGRPRFRIGAHVGNRPHRASMNPETANMCFKDEADDEEGESDAKPAEQSGPPQTDESIRTKPLGPRGLPARGTPHFRISAHQGMRPGGPLSRDMKSETTPENSGGGGDGAGADLSAEMKPKGPGLPSNRGGLMSSSGQRRGGLARTGSGVPGGELKGGGGGSLARTGSGVPGEQRLGGGLARTGSGVPGEQRLGGGLARTGSGVPGEQRLGSGLARQGSGAFGGLARTGSGVPSSRGGNDLKDFSSFLDSTDLKVEEKKSPVTEEENSGNQKSALGKIGHKIGDKWNQLNSYGSPTPEAEVPKDTEVEAPGEVVRSADAAASKTLLDVESVAQ